MFHIPLNTYLQILRSASAEDNPFAQDAAVNEMLGAQFVAMAHAVADFVDAGKEAIGYKQTRTILEDLVHTFPTEEDYVDPFEALLQAMTGGAAVPPPGEEFFTEADEK